MKLVFASDSLKGSLSSKRAGELLRLAAENVFGECETIILPIADGGEGTMDAVLSPGRGEKVMVPAHDPLNRPMEGTYARLSEQEALIEMAAVSGLTLLSPEERNPLFTTTCGVGELIRDALKNGCHRIIIAIGGSATNDGGMGCMQELMSRRDMIRIIFIYLYGKEDKTEYFVNNCGEMIEKEGFRFRDFEIKRRIR